VSDKKIRIYFACIFLSSSHIPKLKKIIASQLQGTIYFFKKLEQTWEIIIFCMNKDRLLRYIGCCFNYNYRSWWGL